MKNARFVRQAILLCGGVGLRMRWLTNDQYPKPLVRVGGKEVLRHCVESLPYPEIRTLIFAVGHQSEQIRQWVSEQNFPHRILFTNPEQGGLLASVAAAASLLEAGSTLVANTDELRIGVDVSKMLEFHKKSRVAGTILAIPADNLYRHRMLVIREDGRVLSSKLKSPEYEHSPEVRGLVNAGMFIVSGKFFSDISDWNRGTPIDYLIETNQLRTYVSFNALYVNVGTEAEYQEAIALLA